MWDVILDAAIDTVKILPLLLVVYIIIEIIEANATAKMRFGRLLSGKGAPVIGSSLGLLPQCGFGVIAANLFSQKTIRLGTLLAVFIATSDEAIPILLSTPGAALKLLPLLLSKFIFACLVGYVANFFVRKKPLALLAEPLEKKADVLSCENLTECGNVDSTVMQSDETTITAAQISQQKKAKTKETIERFIFYPIIHTLKILAYILIINLIMGTVVYLVTPERLMAALESARYFQPLLAGLIGLIPNCASSVVISQLYAGSAISFGAAFAGLAVNAGLGLAVLFKQNKNFKENLVILGVLFASSVLVGFALSFLPF